MDSSSTPRQATLSNQPSVSHNHMCSHKVMVSNRKDTASQPKDTVSLCRDTVSHRRDTVSHRRDTPSHQPIQCTIQMLLHKPKLQLLLQHQCEMQSRRAIATS